jgi:hypothetical protein
MKRLYVLAFLIFFSTGIFAQENLTHDMMILHQAAIERHDDNTFKLIKGNKVVFYHDVIKDDEAYRSNLSWQINKDEFKKKFVLKKNDLLAANVFYYLDCKCDERGYYPVIDGQISGRRIHSDTWQVGVDVYYLDKHGNKQQIKYQGAIFDRSRTF